MEKSDGSRSKHQLWKAIGYVKEGHLSQAELRKSTGPKLDRKGIVYNSLIHHKLVVPHTQRSIGPEPGRPEQQERADTQSNHSEVHALEHQDDFENVLKILKAEDDYVADYPDRHREEEPLQESRPLYQSDHFVHYNSGGSEYRQGLAYNARPNKYERIYTVEECPNSLQENPVEETMRSIPVKNKERTSSKLKTILQQLFLEVKVVIREFRQSVHEERQQINVLYRVLSQRCRDFLQAEQARKQMLSPPRSENFFDNNESIVVRSRTSEQGVSTMQIADETDDFRSEIDRMRKLVAAYQLEINMKSTLISDLQLKNRQAVTTNQFTIERLTNENKHLNLQLNEIQKQFEQERKAIRVKLSTQQDEAAKVESETSNKFNLIGQIRGKDKQINELKQELSEKCSTIEMLIQKIKQIQEENEQQHVTDRYQQDLNQKSKEVQLLMDRIEEYERQLEQNNARIDELSKQNHILNEDNFVMQQKAVGLDAEIAEQLRDQRKQLTREHLVRVTLLEEQTRKINTKYDALKEELARERERARERDRDRERERQRDQQRQRELQHERELQRQRQLQRQRELLRQRELRQRDQRPNHANFIRTSPTYEGRNTVSVPLERQQYYTRDPSRNFEDERHNSIGSLDSHHYGSASGQDTPRLVPTLPIGDSHDRRRFQRERDYATDTRQYLPSSPPLLEAYNNSLLIPSRQLSDKEPSHYSQQELFSPFYKELAPRRETFQPGSRKYEYYPEPQASEPYYTPTSHHHHRNINIHTANVHVNQPAVVAGARYTFNPGVTFKPGSTNILPQRHEPPSRNKGPPMLPPHQPSQTSKHRMDQKPVRDLPSRQTIRTSQQTDQPYMYNQKLDLSRLETQLQNLTKELKHELATVSRKISK